MADEIDNATEADVNIPEAWRTVMLAGRYAAMVIANRLLNVDAEVRSAGDVVHIPIEPQISVNDVTKTTGAVTNQALTATKIDLTVDQWREVSIDVVDMANWQANLDLTTTYNASIAKAMAQDVDAKVANEHSNITTNVVGDAGGADALSDDGLTATIQKLMDLDVPLDDPNATGFYFHTSAWAPLKKLNKFSSAEVTGQAQGGGLTRKVPDIYGVPTFFTTQIKSSGGARKNLLLHREAIAWAMQRNFRLERFARVRKSQAISADWLFGIKTCRENFGVVLNTPAS